MSFCSSFQYWNDEGLGMVDAVPLAVLVAPEADEVMVVFLALVVAPRRPEIKRKKNNQRAFGYIM